MIEFSLINPYLYALCLPALWVYWRFVPPDKRPFAMTIISSALFASASPLFFAFVVFIALIVPWLSQKASSTIIRLSGFGIGLLTILLWKYIFGFYQESIANFFGTSALFSILGVSFMALRITGLLLMAAMPQAPKLSFLECLNFLTFFPTLSAGPLENFAGFIKGRTLSFDSTLFWQSSYKIMFGLFKKIILLELVFQKHFGTQLSAFASSTGPDPFTYSRLDILILALILFLKTLLDISSYNDLARGFAGLFGYRIINDINYPMGVKNLSEYWRNWHVSVMRWCQTHIYFPVFLSTKSVIIGTAASLFVMGIWHEVEWKWLVWGIYQAVGLIALHWWSQQKFLRLKTPNAALVQTSNVVAMMTTLLFTAMAFVIVGPDQFTRSASFLGVLTGLRLP